MKTVDVYGGWLITFKENAPVDDMNYIKQNFLKKIATMFDLIGLLSPFTVLSGKDTSARYVDG